MKKSKNSTVSNPNGLPRPFRPVNIHPSDGNIHGFKPERASQAIPTPIVTRHVVTRQCFTPERASQAIPTEAVTVHWNMQNTVSNPNGLPRPFRRVTTTTLSVVVESFKPERASQALPTAKVSPEKVRDALVSNPNGLPRPFRLSLGRNTPTHG